MMSRDQEKNNVENPIGLSPHWHARLIAIKSSAYAWRQMLFFLSLLPETEVRVFIDWARDHLSLQPDTFRARFNPAITGLARVIDGQPLTDDRPEARRFLGWTTENHWLMA